LRYRSALAHLRSTASVFTGDPPNTIPAFAALSEMVSKTLLGAPVLPSCYGQKYAQGLVQAPRWPVYVNRGLGTVSPPVRLNCRPEVTLLTLRSAGAA